MEGGVSETSDRNLNLEMGILIYMHKIMKAHILSPLGRHYNQKNSVEIERLPLQTVVVLLS